jgi:hypothetical protein
MREIEQGSAANVMVYMTDSADHVTGKTGLTLSVRISKDGGAFGDVAPTITERENGWYELALTGAMTDTLGELCGTVTGAGADAYPFKLLTVEKKPAGAVVADAGNTASAFMTDLTETDDNFWIDAWLRFKSGSLAGQVKKIIGYDGTTKVATLRNAFTGTPAAGDAFEIINR